MRHLVRELDGALLDAAVARAEGYTRYENGNYHRPAELIHGVPVPRYVCPGDARDESGFPMVGRFHPSGDWAQGGPLIERERISLTSPDARERIDGQWGAEVMGTLLERDRGGNDYAFATAATPLIAAMRAYVASKFGEEIELS